MRQLTKPITTDQTLEHEKKRSLQTLKWHMSEILYRTN